MNRLVRLLLPAFLPATLLLPTAPAQAVGAGDPVIVSPSSGSTVKHGWNGPVSIDFVDAPADSYEIDLACNDYDYFESTSFHYDGSQDTFTWSPPAVSGPTGCDLEVYNSYYDVYVTRTFSVAAPPPPPMNVGDASVTPATFYPLVRDGYRDTTKMRYRLNQRANVVATVTKSDGSRVRRVTVGWQRSGSRSWSWNGRRNNGTKVRPGRYTIKVTATSASGSKDAVSRRVSVATATVTRKGSKSRWGDAGNAATGGNCRVTRDRYNGTGTLDCWGGSYAQMTYGFQIPSNAYDFRWSVSGELSSADICCDGIVSKTGTRTSPTQAVVRVKVTGWRAYEVSRVRVSYTYKTRI